MKKIFVVYSIFGIIISILSYKVQGQNGSKNAKIKNKEVVSIKQDTNKNEKCDNLKRFINEEIEPFYNDKFDTLVKKTSLEQLHRDRSILQIATLNDSILNNKISELEEYHKAKLLLTKKYDSLEISNAVKLLKNKKFAGTQTDFMISLLENYSFIKQDLVELIKKINQKKKMPDVEDFIIYAKINTEVFKFLYPDDNNNINMANYPLILDICNRILKSKREDLDKDILYLLREF